MRPKELNHLKQTLLSLKSSDFQSFLKIRNEIFFEVDQYKETEGINLEKPGLLYLSLDDQDQTMLHLNDAIETITGYKKEDFLNKKLACVKGKVEGIISPYPKGKNGFGYDPIFIPNGKTLTFGELSTNIKYKMDHRFKAFQKIKRLL